MKRTFVKVSLFWLFGALFIFCGSLLEKRLTTHAQLIRAVPQTPKPPKLPMTLDKTEVVFELPSGRIYKAVHESCELFITESDWQVSGGGYTRVFNHTYTTTVGRCK